MIRHNRKVVTTALQLLMHDVTAVRMALFGQVTRDIDDKVVFLAFDDEVDQH